MRSPRTLAFSAALVGVAVLGVLMLAAFVTPEQPITRREVDFGRVDSFVPGTVTTFRIFEDSTAPSRMTHDDPFLRNCQRSYAGLLVHIARLEDGSFRALEGRSPHMGEMVPWRQDFSWEGSLGWFREPCHGDTYATDGTRVFGPTPRGLDYYDARVDGGRVMIDLRRLHRGDAPPPFDPDGTPTPAGTPWPTALATEPAAQQ